MNRKTNVVFTTTALNQVKLPAAKDYGRMPDPKTPGLFCKVGREKRVFYLQKRIKGQKNPVTICIGNLAFISVDAARKKARCFAALCDQGRDPREEEKTLRGWTLGDAWDLFLGIKQKTLRPSTLESYVSMYHNHLEPYENRLITDFSPSFLAQLFLESNYPSTLRNVLTLFGNVWEITRKSKLKNGKPMLDESPVASMKQIIGNAWNEIEGRELAVIKLVDLGKYIAMLEYWADHTPYPGKKGVFRAFLLCLFTGMRFHEAATLTWDAVNLNLGTLKVVRRCSKSKREHTIALTDYSRALLQKVRCEALVVSPYVFGKLDGSGPITKRTPLFHEVSDHLLGYYFTSHANRRSFSCFALAKCGIPFPMVQKMMNHAGKTVTEKHYLLLEQFDPGCLRDEFSTVANGLVQCRDAWLAEFRHTLSLPGSKLHQLPVHTNQILQNARQVVNG